jgi:hypothetical protein
MNRKRLHIHALPIVIIALAIFMVSVVSLFTNKYSNSDRLNLRAIINTSYKPAITLHVNRNGLISVRLITATPKAAVEPTQPEANGMAQFSALALEISAIKAQLK